MKRTFSWTLLVVCGTVLMTVALLGPGRLWGQRIAAEAALAGFDTSFEFALELDGEVVGFFGKCNGLVSASDIYEETVLTDSGLQIEQKRPGSRLIWENITLTRNVGATDPVLWQWREQVQGQSPDDALRDGAIILYGPGGETARWYFTNAWPVRLSVNESVEKVTIAHDGLRLVNEAATRSRSR